MNGRYRTGSGRMGGWRQSISLNNSTPHSRLGAVERLRAGSEHITQTKANDECKAKVIRRYTMAAGLPEEILDTIRSMIVN